LITAYFSSQTFTSDNFPVILQIMTNLEIGIFFSCSNAEISCMLNGRPLLSACRSSMDALQKTGMSYDKIGSLIGMVKGQFSEIHQ